MANDLFGGQQSSTRAVAMLLGTVLVSITLAIGLSYPISHVIGQFKASGPRRLSRYDDDIDDFDEFDDIHVRPAARKARRLAGEGARWTSKQARRGVDGVRRLPWGDYGEQAKLGWYKTREHAGRGYEAVRALPWDRYGRHAEDAAEWGIERVRSAKERAKDELEAWRRRQEMPEHRPTMVPAYDYRIYHKPDVSFPSVRAGDTVMQEPTFDAPRGATWMPGGDTQVGSRRRDTLIDVDRISTMGFGRSSAATTRSPRYDTLAGVGARLRPNRKAKSKSKSRR